MGKAIYSWLATLALVILVATPGVWGQDQPEKKEDPKPAKKADQPEKKADDKPADKKGDDKKADEPEKKADEKVDDKPADKKADDKKADEPEKKADEKADDKGKKQEPVEKKIEPVKGLKAQLAARGVEITWQITEEYEKKWGDKLAKFSFQVLRADDVNGKAGKYDRVVEKAFPKSGRVFDDKVEEGKKYHYRLVVKDDEREYVLDAGDVTVFFLLPVEWPQAEINPATENLSVEISWVLPEKYRNMKKDERKRIKLTVLRSPYSGDRPVDLKLTLPVLSQTLEELPISFIDRQVALGDQFLYAIRLEYMGYQIDQTLAAPVFLPPRGVNPRDNGVVELYNRKFLALCVKEEVVTQEGEKFSRERADEILTKLDKSKELAGDYLEDQGILTWREVAGFQKTLGSAPQLLNWKIKKIKPKSGGLLQKPAVELRWEISPDDPASVYGRGNGRVKYYVIERKRTDITQEDVISANKDKDPKDPSWIDLEELSYHKVGQVKAGTGLFLDENATKGATYKYRVVAFDGNNRTVTPVVRLYPNGETTDEVIVAVDFFDWTKLSVILSLLLFAGLFFYFVWMSRKGKELKLRRIEGLNAIEEAIGRATEMGQPVLYVPGIDDIQEIQTVASLVILSHVGKMTAQYESPLIVPCRDSVVMTMAEEVVKEAAISAGRPDAYNPNNIRYLSSEQFAYVAGVDGIMLREKPAANLYLGSFFAESLILAETGYESGAIQVAGTANYHQLPFFIVACDYTIIGEEFYAASAYLSKDAQIIGSIKATDYFKLIIIVMVILLSVGAIFSDDFVYLIVNLLPQ